MMNLLKTGVFASALAVSAISQAASFSLVAEAGVAGVGAGVEMDFSRYLSASAHYTAMDYGLSDIVTPDATYAADIQLRNPQLWLNWAPFGGSFRVSAGVVSQTSSVDLVATNIADQANVQSVTANVDFPESIAPAVTVGWQTPLDSKGLGYRFTLGAMYVGKPDVNVTIRCNNPTFNCFGLEQQEERTIEDDLKQLQLLPIVQFGLLYRL